MFDIGYGGYIKTIETIQKFKDVLDDGKGGYDNDDQISEPVMKNVLTDYILFSLKGRVQYKLKSVIEPPFKIIYENYFTDDNFGFKMKLIRGRYEITDIDNETKHYIQSLINREMYSDDYCLLFASDCVFIDSEYIPEYWIDKYLKNIKYIHLKPNAKSYNEKSSKKGYIEVEHNVDIKVPLIFENYKNDKYGYSTNLFYVDLKDFFHYELVFNKILRSLLENMNYINKFF